MLSVLIQVMPVIILIIFFILLKGLFTNKDKDTLAKRFSQKRLKSVTKKQLRHRKDTGYLGSHFSR